MNSTYDPSDRAASLVCTFHLGEHLFGVDVRNVQEVIRHQDLTPVPLAPVIVRGLINLRGQIVTAIDMRQRLGLQASSCEPKGMNLVIRTSDEVVSLLVDEIGDVVEVDAELFEPPPATLRPEARANITGVYKLDGPLLLLLDTRRITNH